ncbi:hypothetical protein K458DRAFT_485662 [Lentithecium fluviatile CBS 122367]|uniref:F-box domain-containing protein n=1 Tax=Lentithecium fluviatile CBS 122367 TaxID=1168545 RepID=A0A6G1JA99_9PLEO|nr:hypothetical protein K458DRAFT_485662 [Lentithecium fluviatile CBS 122367]
MAENALAPSGPTGRPAHPHPVFAVTKLLEQILSNLNVREIVRAQKVCKLWLECFNGSLKLKQQCFLAAVPETEGNRLVECIENPEILRDTDPAIGRHLVKHTHTAADTPFLAHDGVLGVFFRTFEKPSLTFETAREMFRSLLDFQKLNPFLTFLKESAYWLGQEKEVVLFYSPQFRDHQFHDWREPLELIPKRQERASPGCLEGESGHASCVYKIQGTAYGYLYRGERHKRQGCNGTPACRPASRAT